MWSKDNEKIYQKLQPGQDEQVRLQRKIGILECIEDAAGGKLMRVSIGVKVVFLSRGLQDFLSKCNKHRLSYFYSEMSE